MDDEMSIHLSAVMASPPIVVALLCAADSDPLPLGDESGIHTAAKLGLVG